MLGVALEGGGAKGAFHIGALKALQELGYTINGIVGTSIGAFNAAVVSQGDFEALYQLWTNIEPSTLFDIDDEHMRHLVHAEVNKETLKYLSSKTRQVLKNKGIATDRLMQVVETLVDEDKVRTSQVDFGLVTVSLSELKPVEVLKEDIPEGMLKGYIMASANFPGFKLEPINGKHYIDGGIHDNCPVNLLIQKGYRDIIAVRTQQSEKFSRSIKGDVTILNIVPSQDLGRTLVFDNELVRRNMTMGYYDTLKAVNRLKGSKYYIEPYEDQVFLQLLMNIPEEVIEQMGAALKLYPMDTQRMLFEKVMPVLVDSLRLPSTASYQDIIVGLLEVIASKRNVPCFKVYTIKRFVEAIEQNTVGESLEDKKARHLFKLKEHAAQLLGNQGQMVTELAEVIFDTMDKSYFDKYLY